MKYILTLFVAFCSVFIAIAQEERLPEFPGGVQGFTEYLRKELRYPKQAQSAKIEGKVLIAMVIERDGTLTNIKVREGVSPELDAEAVRVITASPKWSPGIQDGRLVRVAYRVPIIFRLK